MKLEEVVRKYALKNAYDYGKAKASAVVGKVLYEFPEAKKDMKKTMEIINKIVEEVNRMDKKEIEEEIKKYKFERKTQEQRLELKGAEKGKVITRFPPEPSGYLHIGHAKAAWLNREVADQYSGKMILRIDDTNPEKESWEYVNAIKEDLDWLGIKWDGITYTSDNIEILYKYAETMLEDGSAYICTCPPEEIKKNRAEGKECSCRSKKDLELWKKMHKDLEEGSAIVRLKGNVKAKNTVMRDPTLLRIIEKEHYKQGKKYRVWPTYDFAVPIMDSVEGITHAMRSKEYELRDELYHYIQSLLNLRKVEIISFSRLNIKNAPVSKRLILPLVKEKKVMGWDDPRLPTIKGLKRRGIVPEAIKKFVLSFGLGKIESEPGWEKLLAFNRQIVEKSAEHYFFVPNPVELRIKNPKERIVRLKRKNKEKVVRVENRIWIAQEDFEKIKEGEMFRLKDFANAVLFKEKKELEIIEEGMAKSKIQWVSEPLEATVLKPLELFENEKFVEDSLKKIKGYVEKDAKEIKKGEIVQFERFGFCIRDDESKMIFVYSC